MNNHQLNITIAKLLGLEITVKHVSPDGFYPRRVKDEPFKTSTGAQSLERIYADGKPLKPYHRDARYAVKALERVCDERRLVVEFRRIPDREWIVELSPHAVRDTEPFTLGRDKSFPLAICKALGELTNEN